MTTSTFSVRFEIVTTSRPARRTSVSRSSTTVGPGRAWTVMVERIEWLWRIFSMRPRPARTTMTASVVPAPAREWREPSAMPIAATTQMVAALVSPTTAPRAWRIVPAPMKPTPVTIWAATRVVSVPGGIDPPPADSIASDRWVYSTEPTQIRMLVRSPAGLPPISRSRPIAPPSSVARPSCSIKSSRKISTMRPRTSATQESHAIADLGDRAARELTGFRRAAPQALQHARRLGAQRRGALAHRRQRRDHVVRQHPLAIETAPPRRPALLRHLRDRRGRRKSLMQCVDVADLRRARILARLARGIGRGGPQLFPNRLGRLEQADRVAETLRHLGLAVESQDALRLREQRLRLREEPVAVARVPAARDLAHQLEVLDLILADRNETSFIEQHVSGLQDGVREKPGQHALLALGLVLELRLALELAERRHGCEHPVELGVLGNVRLDEDDALRRIEAGRVQADRHVHRQRRQTRRIVALGDGVEIDDAEEAVVLGLETDPVLDRAEVVADVELVGRLDTAEDAFHSRRGHGATRCVNTTT